MISVHLWDDNHKFDYYLQLKRKVTIVQGDSGVGKSLFVNLSEQSITDNSIHFDCNLRLSILSPTDWMSFSGKNCVIPIDEYHPLLQSGDCLRFFEKTNCYFIVITRKLLAWFPCQPEDIYLMIKSHNKRTLIPAFNLKEENYQKPDLVVTEDGGAGYKFYKLLWSSLDFPVISSYGKENLVAVVDRQYRSKNSTLIIADRFGFGAVMGFMLKYVNTGSVNLFLPNSFEWLLLKSEMFCEYNDVREFIKSVETSEFSTEVNYEVRTTKFLKSITEGCPCHYKKEELGLCYKVPCCHRKGPSCKFRINGDKLQILFSAYIDKFLFMDGNV